MQRNKSKMKKADENGKVTKKAKISMGKCEFYKQHNIEELRDSILLQVQDIEDLVSISKVIKACPYYASRKAAEDAEVVLIPYNTILHKPTREANGIKLKNNIVIIDEAHNLLEAISQMYSSEVTYLQLFHSHKQLKNYKAKYSTRFSAPNLLGINQLIFIINKLLEVLDKRASISENEILTIGNFVLSAEIDNYNMFKLVKFCKDSRIGHKLHGFSVKHPQEANETKQGVKKGIKQFLSSIEAQKKDTNKETSETSEQSKSEFIPTNPLLPAISFLESLTYSYDDGRIMVINSSDKNQRKLQFLLLNPTENFKDIVKDARAVCFVYINHILVYVVLFFFV
ncbi:hypothetical protein AMK59_4066 [Oryctes borbonicus]|uniref:Helicase ATP-binding domain-containing protein n=1 Tax=Oryctes borbonicus TaxID=1629725 RepID=A0A0T6B8D0_9SCAR|nr:hypothetical protein AMK59_4066 [Oryctes borbonicus]